MKKTKNSYLENRILGILCLFVAGLVLVAILNGSVHFAFGLPLNENPVMTEARQLQLAPGSVSGLLVQPGLHVLSRANTEIDFGHPEKGVFDIRYTGEKEALQVWVEKTQGGQRAVYPCPADGSWACLPLPFGAGEYTVTTNPYDPKDLLSRGEDRVAFTLTATYTDEAEPFRYANLFSNYNENSLETRAACVIETQEREKLGRAPTNRELADAVVSFVFENIIGKGTLAEQRKDADAFYYFPDNALTLEEGRGTCADKASVAAAMLKSLGVPVRIHYGYIEKAAHLNPEQVYHAWLNVRLDGAWVMYDPSYSPDEIDASETGGKIKYLFDTVTVQ